MRMLPRLYPPAEDMVALMEGELRLPERSALRRHLSGSDRCHTLLDRLEHAMLALAAELAAEPADAGVDATETAPRWRVRPAVPVGVLVGALLVAGWVGLQQRRAGVRIQSAA